MSYHHNRYLSFQTRQEQEQEEQQSQANEKEKEQEQIFSTATVWISGGNRPTLYIPYGLAKKYRMDPLLKIILLLYSYRYL